MTTTVYKIDAKGRTIGRVSSEAASVLMGKASPAFQKNIAADVSVVIENASKVSVAPSKLKIVQQKLFSGYPGGLKERTLAQMIEKKGYGEVLVHAISRMIPRNRLHKARMKHLTVTE